MTMKDLAKGAHIHLMGICGTAMASLAGLLQARGFRVTGSEMTPYPPMSTQIESLGISIAKPYKAENLSPRPDFVIVGNVISANNPEAQELVRLGIPFTSLPKAMGELIIADREAIVIAGTHGKTTTTSLLSWVATDLGFQPGFLIGGIAKNFSKSFENGKPPYFVIEGDEYDTAYFDKVPKFVHYRPRHVILTSVEFDHADIYPDLQAVKRAFVSLMKLIPENGTLVYHAEDLNVQEVVRSAKVKHTLSYGLNQGDYRAQIVETGPQGTVFRVQHKGQLVGEFQMALTGEYNVLNATAAIALGQRLGWSHEGVAKALKSFAGVKRRQEILGEPKGVLVIEDFAHHPTAVRETLKGISERYRGRRLLAIFEPRSATSRRKIFQKEYAKAFQTASQTWLMQAFDQSKIDSQDRFSSEELAVDIQGQGRQAAAYPDVNQIVESVGQVAKSGDVLVVMSNGGFDGIYDKLLQRLSR